MLGRISCSVLLLVCLALPLAGQTSGSGPADSDHSAPPASQASDGGASDSSSSSSSPQAVSGHSDAPADQQGASSQPAEAKKPGGIKKVLRRAEPNCVHVGGAADHCWSESEQEKEAEQKRAQEAAQQPPVPPSQPVPRSSGVECADCSSSRDTHVDLSPPPGDAATHEGADLRDDVQEVHPWDPHRADKDVEVGDFYFKQKNYRAAIARYQDALQWMPNHAVAIYRLAQALEKSGDTSEARKNYQQYLKLLPQGEYAEPARKALERLQSTAQSRATPPSERKSR